MSERSAPIVRPSDWPALDRRLWMTATAKGTDLLDLPGRASHLRPASRELYEEAYGHWLGWLQARGELSSDLPPASRVSPERIVAYVEDQRTILAPVTVAIRLTGIACLLRLIVPDFDVRQICAVRDRLNRTPLKDKRRLVREPVALYELGERLMRDGLAGMSGNRKIDAVRYRDGLIIATLALRPLRKRNVSSLEIGHHLVRDRTGWRIVLPATETKAHVPVDVPYPAVLIEALETYIHTIRPILLGHLTCARLWVSLRGTPLSSTSLAILVASRTAAEFGIGLSPHRFRDSAATMLAVHRPEEVRAAAAVLGHASYRTTQSHYNQAQSIHAARRYEQAYAALRDREEPR